MTREEHIAQLFELYDYVSEQVEEFKSRFIGEAASASLVERINFELSFLFRNLVSEGHLSSVPPFEAELMPGGVIQVNFNLVNALPDHLHSVYIYLFERAVEHRGENPSTIDIITTAEVMSAKKNELPALMVADDPFRRALAKERMEELSKEI